jgi:uncharacterized protein
MANWDTIQSRGEVDDRRGMATGLSSIGIGGMVLLMGLTYLMGGNPLDVLLQIDPNQLRTTTNTEQPAEYAGQDSYEVFASTVLGSTNDIWNTLFQKQNKEYIAPKLVLFRDGTTSACGGAVSMVGPHYCPLDQTIYLDETFFDQLTDRLGARGGDVAEAYVIAHEVGHHVQELQGSLQARRSNEDSIKVELQADCYAGVWAHSVSQLNVFTPGEIAEAMDAAAAVGDDRIQEMTQGSVHKESWTHGSSADRVKWFTKGFEEGTIQACTMEV